MADNTNTAGITEEGLTVVQRESVLFYGHHIAAVRLSDGRIAAVFTDVCKAIGLSRGPQARRVRMDDTLWDQLLTIEMDPDGSGIRPTDVLTAWAIPLWLTGIQINRVSADKKDAILAFKREAADALYRHFSQPQQLALEPPADIVPAEPLERPTAPSQDAAASVWIQYHRQMAEFLEWQQDLEQWRGDMEARMESIEEVTRLVPEILERLGPATLSPEHQRSVQIYANRLSELTGAKHAALYGELKDVFHVGSYKDIPESQWADVAQWFTARIRKAERP